MQLHLCIASPFQLIWKNSRPLTNQGHSTLVQPWRHPGPPVSSAWHALSDPTKAGTERAMMICTQLSPTCVPSAESHSWMNTKTAPNILNNKECWNCIQPNQEIQTSKIIKELGSHDFTNRSQHSIASGLRMKAKSCAIPEPLPRCIECGDTHNSEQ